MKRILLHIPHGLIVVFSGMCVSLWLATLFMVAFIYYEVRQHNITRDQAWKDIAGLLWGMGIALGLLTIYRIASM